VEGFDQGFSGENGHVVIDQGFLEIPLGSYPLYRYLSKQLVNHVRHRKLSRLHGCQSSPLAQQAAFRRFLPAVGRNPGRRGVELLFYTVRL
jgi:hypothetical protein